MCRHYSIRQFPIRIRFRMVRHSRAPSARRRPTPVARPCRLCTSGATSCMLTRGGTVRLQIHSNFDMLDFVQVVSDHIGAARRPRRGRRPLDRRRGPRVGDQRHQARQPRGSRQARHRRVHLRAGRGARASSIVRVLDQGEGFEPEEVADPLAPENLLKSSGRGIFFMRSFMDDVTLQRARPRAAWKCGW